MGVLGGVFVLKSGLRILIRAPEVPFLVPPMTHYLFYLSHLDTLGTILDPRKVIFGHFIFLVIFPLKFPLKPKKFRTLISLGQIAQLLHICFQEAKCNQEI